MMFVLRSSTHMGPSHKGPRPTDRSEGLQGSKCVAGHMKSAGCNYDVYDEPGTWSPAQQRDNNHYLGKIKEMHHAYATVSSLYPSAINSQ